MRGAFILTVLLGLLVIGWLVIQNMDSHTQAGDNGQVEEVERARDAAGRAEDRAEENMDAIRESVNQDD